ncbi:MAG: extracellular solute-binding protein [Desulfosalsimonadaceae bacterium]
MKKILILSLMLALMVVFASTGIAENKLYIYNWTYYTPDEVIKGFEEKFHVKVVYDEFASNEEMFAKLKAGGTGYDITFPSADYTTIMIKEGMLEKIDKSKVPNFANIDPELIKAVTYDKNCEYSVPYMKGASGVAVNKKYVKNYKKDMSVYLKPELKGRMTLLDDMREVMGFALKANGFSVNTINPAELNKAKDLVMQWKANILKFDAESFGKGFASGEFWVVQGYEENIFSELEDKAKKDTDFFIPATGGPCYIDSMVILKDSKNKDLALKFINYIHEPAQYAKFVDKFGFPSINVPARKIRTGKPVYTEEDLKKCELKLDLGANLELYNKIWEEIKNE